MPLSLTPTALQRMSRAGPFSGCMLFWLLCACSGGAATEHGDGPLVVLLPREALEIDPRFSGDPYGHKVSRLLFASLVTIDPQTLEVVPDLAEEVVIESPTRYRAKLRSGLRFSDGTALDADDVAATFRSVVDPGFGSRYASTYSQIERVEVVSPLEVVFHLRGPHATFLADLELPVLRAEDEHRHLGALGAAAPAGAGPYVLASRSASQIDLVANPHWYGGAVRFPVVRMLVVHDDNTRALRLLAGAGDLAMSAVPPLLLPLFEHDPRFVVRSAPGVGTTYMGLNLEAAALRDVRVREALAYGIDREALVRAKLSGRARLASSFIVPGHWAHAAETPRYGYDPARARALLRAAGRGSGRLHLSLRCGSDRFRQSIARAIVAMLADVGIDVELRPSEVATLIADLNRGRFELTMLEVPEVVEPHVLSWFFGADHVPGNGREGANRWRFRNTDFDAAIEQGRRSVERPARVRAYADAQRILAEQLPVIPLWHEDVVAVENGRARAFAVPRLGRFGPLAR
ncbi:MAG: ABC transporter substrate-binding protein [Polyangiales bacterium]